MADGILQHRFNFLIGSLSQGMSSPSPSRLMPSKRLSRAELPNTLVKAKSASQLGKMAMVATPPRGRTLLDNDSNYLNTLPDPRTPSPGPRTPSTDSQHPDLSNEVAMLSTKLVNAINHQTNLDDSLQQSRFELEAARRRLAELETKTKEHARQLSAGLLLQKPDVDKTISAMRDELLEAQKARDISEKGRKEMEVELETLTTALFEEANTMVAAARKESEATERKNAQLRSQLNDTELLLASQQEQLADLKNTMEKMSSERDETETLPRSSTAPSTPGHDTANKMSRMFDTFPMSPNAPTFGEIPPDQPLRFSHLITPVMRSDVQAYADFAELLKTSRAAAHSHSRASSGATFSNANASNSSAPLASSSPNIPGSFSSGVTSSPRDTAYAASLPPLKDNKFYKRCLAEDIEPALRLDLAPGLSWLARRTVVGAITSGTLVVEPFIPQSRFYGNVYACSLCGESRRTDSHTRRHRFRTSEDDSAQRYPLCEYCLGRVRATCDFLGFLRMVRDGLWRAQTDEDINGAWEESVRLREKMFWARLGGGVVPVVSTRGESPTATQRRAQGTLLRQDSSMTDATDTSLGDDTRNSLDSPRIVTGVPKIQDPFKAKSRSLDKSDPRKGDQPTEEPADGVQTADFAATKSSIGQEAPSTPISSSEAPPDTNLDRPTTPKSQTTTVESLEVPDVSVGSQDQPEEHNTRPPSIRTIVEDAATGSAVPGSFD